MICASKTPLIAVLAILVFLAPPGVRAQTAFFNFDAPGGLVAGFALWNDVGGSNGGNPDFAESTTAGVGGGGGVSVFQSTDTTAVCSAQSWNLSTNGASLSASVMVLANGQSSGNKVQLGVLNTNLGGLNSDPGIAFESFRFIPASDTVWTLREQIRTGNATTETLLGNVNVAPGRWYKFSVTVTNAGGGFVAWCDLADFGTNGLVPGPSVVSFPTLRTNTAPDVTSAAVRPALRAFQNAGIDAWDNFLAFTPSSPPTLTLPPPNLSVIDGDRPAINVFAEGPGPITYAWFTNGVAVQGISGPMYTPPPIHAGFSNIAVTASNANGRASSPPGTGLVTLFVPKPPTVTLLPVGAVDDSSAVVSGSVTDTGGLTPSVTLFFGQADGGENPASWSNNIALGPTTGAFTELVTGLSPTTRYFVNAEAANAAGASWAGSSRSFTTTATPPFTRGVGVLTHHNDLYRTGANLFETRLNSFNVNTNQFGLLYTLPVDDQVYAQPLLMTNVSVPGRGLRNLLIVATVNDTLFAFDADAAGPAAPLWSRSLLANGGVPPRNSDMTGACGGGYQDFSGNMGIVGTPTIDPATGTLFVVARTKETTGAFLQWLHAIDVATGADHTNSPVNITASVAGTGDGSVNGVITFDGQHQNQRPALTLANGTVYIAWSSHCDWRPYHGWVIGYDAATLNRTIVYNNTPNGYEGGIWMSNHGPAVDETGNVYLSTGNGSVGAPGNPKDVINRGESFLKLTPSGGTLAVSSWFTPHNWQDLENYDLDLGTGGVLLIPGTPLMFSGGKQGWMYLVNRDNMGGLSDVPTDSNVLQSFQVSGDAVHGGPVWWAGPSNRCAYVWPASDHLQQYPLDPVNQVFKLTARILGTPVAPQGQPGGILSLSANGSTAGSGVLWASHQASGDANQATRPGILRAFDAENVGRELWNSQMVMKRDDVGNFAKFCPPTVANGRVYLATFSNRINVYGLFPPPALTASASAGRLTIEWPQSASAYHLETASEPAAGPWMTVTNTPTATNGIIRVTLPEADADAFFRLKH
jgi:hypothetical protein